MFLQTINLYKKLMKTRISFSLDAVLPPQVPAPLPLAWWEMYCHLQKKLEIKKMRNKKYKYTPNKLNPRTS